MTAPYTKPQRYSFDMAKRIVATMAKHKCGMARACDMSPDLPSAETARHWLNQEPSFRAIYPNRRKTWFAHLSEADIAERRAQWAR